MHTTFSLLAALLGSAIALPGMGNMGAGQKRNPAVVESDAMLEERAAKAANATGCKPFLGPRKGDVRSPCPGLNALANHDICPRNGKGYTIPLLTKCLAEGMNMGADFSLFVGAAGIGSNPNFLPSLSFDLDQLRRHEIRIEHDASLSRADVSTGDNYSFNQTIWDTVLAYYDGMESTSIPVAAKAKYMRVQTEKARDPTFTYGPVQFIFSYGETAIYISTMGDPTTGVAPVKYVRSLFEEERLPYEEGWRPTKEPTTLGSLAAMIFELNVANGEELPEGLTLTETTLRAALRGLDPITGKVLDPALQTIGGLLGIK